jgi:hypothetical protein
MTDAPAAATPGANQIDLFARGSDNRLWDNQYR